MAATNPQDVLDALPNPPAEVDYAELVTQMTVSGKIKSLQRHFHPMRREGQLLTRNQKDAETGRLVMWVSKPS